MLTSETIYFNINTNIIMSIVRSFTYIVSQIGESQCKTNYLIHFPLSFCIDSELTTYYPYIFSLHLCKNYSGPSAFDNNPSFALS